MSDNEQPINEMLARITALNESLKQWDEDIKAIQKTASEWIQEMQEIDKEIIKCKSNKAK